MISIKKLVYDNKNVIAAQVADTINGFIDPATYFALLYNTLTSKLVFDNIDRLKLEQALKEKQWQTLQEFNKVIGSNSTKEISPSKQVAEIFDEYLDKTWEKEKVSYVKEKYFITVNGLTDGTCEIFAYYDSSDKEAKKFLCNFILPLKKTEKNKEPHFLLLTKNSFGELDLKKYSAKLPADVDINANYGIEFEKINSTITEKLGKKTFGLYVLHGAPGTGKSTYIKWLANSIDKKFIYIPEFMAGMINDPAVMQLFMEYPNSVIVLEDAEKLILNRDNDSNSSMTSLILNLTDGIMADIMKLSIIVTYNTKSENIDKALLRKGRLQYIHEFKPLSKNDTINLMSTHGITKKQIDELQKKDLIKDEMTLADIYNIYDQTGMQPNKKKVVPLGFGA